MSDIITKAQAAVGSTQTDALANWQKAWEALKAFSGLMLSELDEGAQAAVETELVAVNRILASYDNGSEEDYEQLTDSDAAEILEHVQSAARLCIDSEAKRVMRQLDTAGRELPVAAIEEVRMHRDVFVPLLIESVKKAIARVRNGEEPKEDASFFAVFLLVELDVGEAFPVLLEAIRLPGEGPFDVLGDGIHELLPAALALFSQGNVRAIDDIVADSDLNMFVRWAAANAYKFLVRDESISREEAIDSIHRQFQECMQNEDDDLLAPLACELGNLAAESALETIRAAYERRLVDRSIVQLKFIEAQIAAGEETVRRALEDCRPTGMPDTIAELGSWAGFQKQPARQPKPPSLQPALRPQSQASSLVPPATTKSIRFDAKVGRNDPCPCGSGKKFKKCCR